MYFVKVCFTESHYSLNGNVVFETGCISKDSEVIVLILSKFAFSSSMFLNTSIYLFIYLFVYLFIFLFIHLFIYLFINCFKNCMHINLDSKNLIKNLSLRSRSSHIIIYQSLSINRIYMCINFTRKKQST